MFIKKIALLVCLCMLVCCLTGCQELNYREAVQRYNAHQYEIANELFYELGDYKDSQELFTASHYWMAMELMDAGHYSEALPRFLKLGEYADSAQRAVECKYQSAIAAFEEENYADAENLFRDAPDYRQTPEYLRQLNWQKLYDYIAGSGSESGGSYVVSQTVGDCLVNFVADITTPGQLLMASSREKDMGYIFSDALQLTLPRDSTVATFTAGSGFTMDFGQEQIGTQQTASGTVELATYADGQKLVFDVFDMSGMDNLGNEISTQDPAASTMDDDIVLHMRAILTALSTLQAMSETEAIF